jgi:heme exporter protein D
MEGVSEFFAMGGYAQFIWPAYLLPAVILTVLLVLSLRGLRRNEDTLKTLRAERRGSIDDEADT